MSDRAADADAHRAFLQGSLLGAVLFHRAGVKDTKVEQGLDTQGGYEHWFTIITQAGHRIRVTVEVEDG